MHPGHPLRWVPLLRPPRRAERLRAGPRTVTRGARPAHRPTPESAPPLGSAARETPRGEPRAAPRAGKPSSKSSGATCDYHTLRVTSGQAAPAESWESLTRRCQGFWTRGYGNVWSVVWEVWCVGGSPSRLGGLFPSGVGGSRVPGPQKTHRPAHWLVMTIRSEFSHTWKKWFDLTKI